MFKLIEVQCNVLLLSVFGVELDVKNERKRKTSRVDLRTLDPGSHDSNLLCEQLSWICT